MAGIMDQIANPQMADIAGALDYRQKRLDADEQKRKKIRIGQLVAEAVPNLQEGSPLYNLATESPEQFAVFAKATGIPLNSGEQFQQLSNDTALLYNTAQSDPYAAIETAQSLKRERNEAGQETPQLDKWLQTVDSDPTAAFTALFTMHRSINQGDQGQSKVQSSDILDDGTTIQVLSDGRTRVVDPEGNELEGKDRAEAIERGQEFGVDIQSRRAGGRTRSTLIERGEREPELQADIRTAEERAKGTAQRSQGFVDQGVVAAESIPVLSRSIQLLDEVETGGLSAVGSRARRIFGVEGADEGELSYNLGKSVLSQLRETFGAAFTEAEGARLERLEASLGRSPAANRRILGQALQVAQAKANRGISAAQDIGDEFAAQDIRRFMEMQLGSDEEQEGGEGSTQSENQRIRFDAEGNIIQ